MTTIHGFSTKNKDWEKSLIDDISKQGGSIIIPFEAEGMIVERDPFSGIRKDALEPLTYEVR